MRVLFVVSIHEHFKTSSLRDGNETHITLRLNLVTTLLTSREHCKRELQSFSHCGSFDHPDLQSLNDCIFVFGFTN